MALLILFLPVLLGAAFLIWLGFCGFIYMAVRIGQLITRSFKKFI
jgi:hypothetical protein